MGRLNYLNNVLNTIILEGVEENSTGFDNYEDFSKRDKSTDVYVYHRTKSENISSIFNFGGLGCREWGETMAYGKGIYTTLGNGWNQVGDYYGDCVIKFRLKNGLRNCIYENENIQKRAYDMIVPNAKNKNYQEKMNGFGDYDDYGNWSFKYRPYRERMKNSMSKKDFERYEDYYSKHNSYNRGSKLPDDLYDTNDVINPGGKIMSKLSKNVYKNDDNHTDDEYFDRSNLDGIIFDYCGPLCVLIKKADVLIPVEFAMIKDWEEKWDGVRPSERDDSPEQLEWHTTDDNQVDRFGNPIKIGNEEDRFDNLNNTGDVLRFRDYDAGYDDYRTPKPTRGLVLLKKPADSSGHYKGNYIHCKTGKKMFFSDVDNPQDISDDGVAYFDIGERHMRMVIDKNYDVSINEYVKSRDGKTQITKNSFTIETLNHNVAFNRTYQEIVKMADNGELPVIYKSVPPEDVESIMKTGVDPEKVGLKGDTSLYYGRGVYATRDKSVADSGNYGGGKVSFVQKNGYDDFLIFDNDARGEYDPGNTVYDEIIRLVPKDKLGELDDKLKSNQYALRKIQDFGLEAYKDIPDGFNAGYAKAFYEAMSDGSDSKTGAGSSKDESLLAQTGIQGYIYNGANDQLSVMPRDFSSSIPLTGNDEQDDYVIGGIRKSQASQDDIEQAYNRANKKVYGYSRKGYKGQFNDTGTEGVISWPEKGGKRNYQYADGNMMLPYSVNDYDATDFVDNGNGGSANFNFTAGGVDYPTTMKVENDLPVFYFTYKGKNQRIVGKHAMKKVIDLLNSKSGN